MALTPFAIVTRVHPSATANRIIKDGLSLPMLLIVLTAVLAVVALVPVPTFVRAVVGLPLGFTLPGAVLFPALFPALRREDKILALGLVPTLSLAVYPPICLVLYVLQRPINTTTIVLGITLMIVAALFVAQHRRAGVPWPRLHSRLSGGGYRSAGIVTAPLAAIGLGFAIGGYLAPPPYLAPYSQLYLSGGWSQLAEIPSVAPGTWFTMTMTAANHTGRTRTYHVTVLLDGRLSWPGYTVPLHPGATWNGLLHGLVPGDRCLHRLTATLTGGGGRSNPTLVLYLHSSNVRDAACLRSLHDTHIPSATSRQGHS